MIIRNNYFTGEPGFSYTGRYVNLQRSKYVDSVIGTIVGFNIKPIVNPDLTYNYGMFVHVKTDDGDQYDYIFDTFANNVVVQGMIYTPEYSKVDWGLTAYRRVRMTWDQIKPLIKMAKHAKRDKTEDLNSTMFSTHLNQVPSILALLYVCNANELVELIGKKVKITIIRPEPDKPVKKKLSVVMEMAAYPPDRSRHASIVPIAFEVHTGKDDINDFIRRYIARYPDDQVPAFDRDEYQWKS